MSQKREVFSRAGHAGAQPEAVSAAQTQARGGLLGFFTAEPRRLPLAVVGLTVLLLLVALTFRRHATEIELDATLSRVRFTASVQEMLTPPLQLSALGVSGLRELEVPDADGGAGSMSPSATSDAPAVRLSAETVGDRHGTITLARVGVPAGTTVEARRTELAHQYRLSLSGAPVKFQADVDGPIRLDRSGASTEHYDFETPSAIVFTAGPSAVHLDITMLGTSAIRFSPVQATGLSLVDVDDFTSESFAAVREVSTVLSGTLYFDELDGKERKLRSGEMLRLAGSTGEIRRLVLTDDGLAIEFHGRVSGMATGSRQYGADLMPTWFEWLAAQHGLTLLWGTTIYLFGIVYPALRWWMSTR